MTKIKNFFSFKFDKENIIALLALVFSIIYIKIFSLHQIYENSFLENTQLIVLFLAFCFCFKVKKYKVLFNVIKMVLILMFLRETSYGRVFFAHIEGGGPEDFYQLSHYKYGFLVNIIVGLYVASIALYGVVKKVWLDIKSIILSFKMPFWMMLEAFAFIFIQILSEEFLDNTLIEETMELMLYSLILGIIIYYKKEIKKKINQK